jgi:hypothetical protein
MSLWPILLEEADVTKNTPVDEKEPAEGSREVVDRELKRQEQKHGKDQGQLKSRSSNKSRQKRAE